ncbi:amiloride-sensitive sodium channel subunit beta-like [Liolophura sinensis]|uniref:amiloride-sensitive sodium channel subunit beta-like n=1 Tax=Liolophura sinensis TaxID=3198878 RepID=UPI0031597F1C
MKYPSEVDMVLKFAPELEFPSVTVCNLNPLRYDKLGRTEYGERFHNLKDDGTDDILYQSAHRHFVPGDNSRESSEEMGPTSDYYGTPYSTPYSYGTQATWPTGNPDGPEWPGEPGDGEGEKTDPPQMNSPGEGQPGGAPQPTSGLSTPGTSSSSSSKPPKLHRRRRAANNTGQETANFTSIISNSSYNQWEYLGEDTADSFYNKVSSQHQAMSTVSDIIATMDAQKVSELGHQKKDFIMGCKWQGYPCSPSNFTSFVNYKYGNCFTFNADVNSSHPKLKTSNPGPLYGLELELFIEQDEYVPSVSQEAGARVVVHTRGKVPFPEDEGFTVSPGYMTSVGMRKTSIIRLGYPHGNCTTEFTGLNSLYEKVNTVYSKQACMKSCYQTALISQYNCTQAVRRLHTANKLGCDDACPLPCSDEAFTLTISNAVWPGRKYQADLYSKMTKSSTKLMRSARQGGYSYDVAKVEIFYQELNYQVIEQKPSYEFENVISDLGGQLGLWLGISILALGEIIDFFVSVIHFCIFKVTSSSQHRPGATPVYPYRPPKQ